MIAETGALETAFRKIVVTDDQGRFVVPDLPRSGGKPYKVWVRGYGLVDSPPVPVNLGRQVTLQAVVAPNAQAAAQIYPADYWYSLIKVPDASEFPGTGPSGNGISPELTSQAHWITEMKDGCQLCHQLGNKATRETSGEVRRAASEYSWVGAAPSGRSARPADERRAESVRPRARVADVRRLVGPHQGRRGSAATATTPRRRTQHRALPVGMGRSKRLHPR